MANDCIMRQRGRVDGQEVIVCGHLLDNQFVEKMFEWYKHMDVTYMQNTQFNNEIYFVLFFASQHCFLFRGLMRDNPETETTLALIHKMEGLHGEVIGLHALRMLIYVLWMADYEGFQDKVRRTSDKLLSEGYLAEKPSVLRKDYLDEISFQTIASTLVSFNDNEDIKARLSKEGVNLFNHFHIFSTEDAKITVEDIDALTKVLMLADILILMEDINQTDPETKTALTRTAHSRKQLDAAKKAIMH